MPGIYTGNLASMRVSPMEKETPGINPKAGSPSSGMAHISRMALPRTFKRGGIVKRSGIAKLHKGERVTTARKYRAAKAVLGKPTKKPRTPNTTHAKTKIKKTLHEWKAGTLHSGSKQGPVVKDQRQAVAIALSQAREKA